MTAYKTISGRRLASQGRDFQGTLEIRKCIITTSSLDCKVTRSEAQLQLKLSCSFFTLYIADIPHPPDTQLALYADDIAILSQSWRPETISCRLNSAMYQLLRYFNKCKLRVNVSKTELILFTKRRPPVPKPLQFQNVTIP